MTMNDTDADRLEIAFRDAYRANDDVRFDSAVEALRTFVKRFRQRLLSAAGDDLCRLTQDEIKALSDGSVKIPPKEEFLASCERFHAQIAKESGGDGKLLDPRPAYCGKRVADATTCCYSDRSGTSKVTE